MAAFATSDDRDKRRQRIQQMIQEAHQKTMQGLADDISSLCAFREDELQSFFPDKQELMDLADLIEIVNDNTDRNEKFLRIMNESHRFGNIVLNLLERIV